MSDPTLKAAATKLAEETPEYLGKPTTPPISWRRDGHVLKVILADGRAIHAYHLFDIPVEKETQRLTTKTYPRPDPIQPMVAESATTKAAIPPTPTAPAPHAGKPPLLPKAQPLSTPARKNGRK